MFKAERQRNRQARSPAERRPTLACDGPCNVISGALSGRDRPQRRRRPSGRGAGHRPDGDPARNYIGLVAAGGEALGNAGTGVFVGQGKGVTIGGTLGGDANHLNGGNFGILAGSAGVGADNLEIEGNLIGVTVPGTSTLQPPSTAAISVDSAGVSSLAAAAGISGNAISMFGGVGMEQHGPGAAIAKNEIFGGLFGIRAYGFVGAQGNTIEGNLVANASEAGMLLENDANTVFGNDIEGSGGVGILVGSGILTGPGSGNLIGGDTAASENTISSNAGAAIVVAGEESIQNEVRRNNGINNGGLFIDLGKNGSGNPSATGPNGGIQVPAVSSATLSAAGGTASPTRRSGSSARRPKPPAARLASNSSPPTTADASGNWSSGLTRSSVPAGTNRRRDRRRPPLGGTSELAATATAATDPALSRGPARFTGGGGLRRPAPRPRAPDTTAPTATVGGKAPGGQDRPAPPPSSSSPPTRAARPSSASSTRASSRAASRRRPTRS